MSTASETVEGSNSAQLSSSSQEISVFFACMQRQGDRIQTM